MLASVMPQKSDDTDTRRKQSWARGKYHRYFEPTLLDGPKGKSSIIAYTHLRMEGEENLF